MNARFCQALTEVGSSRNASSKIANGLPEIDRPSPGPWRSNRLSRSAFDAGQSANIRWPAPYFPGCAASAISRTASESTLDPKPTHDRYQRLRHRSHPIVRELAPSEDRSLRIDHTVELPGCNLAWLPPNHSEQPLLVLADSRRYARWGTLQSRRKNSSGHFRVGRA